MPRLLVATGLNLLHPLRRSEVGVPESGEVALLVRARSPTGLYNTHSLMPACHGCGGKWLLCLSIASRLTAKAAWRRLSSAGDAYTGQAAGASGCWERCWEPKRGCGGHGCSLFLCFVLKSTQGSACVPGITTKITRVRRYNRISFFWMKKNEAGLKKKREIRMGTSIHN